MTIAIVLYNVEKKKKKGFYRFFCKNCGAEMKNKQIAKVLKTYRKQNQYSINDVAMFLKEKDIKVAPKTIYGWESGQAQPDADTLLVLCEIYNITDILATFGYVEKGTFPLTTLEKELVIQFRKHPPLQDAVRKLLDF